MNLWFNVSLIWLSNSWLLWEEHQSISCCRRICEHQLQIPTIPQGWWEVYLQEIWIWSLCWRDVCEWEQKMERCGTDPAVWWQRAAAPDGNHQSCDSTFSEYWCGVQSEGHKSFITRVLISVTGTDDFLRTSLIITASFHSADHCVSWIMFLECAKKVI